MRLLNILCRFGCIYIELFITYGVRFWFYFFFLQQQQQQIMINKIIKNPKPPTKPATRATGKLRGYDNFS
jgi:hypothetical protein